jgi:hypothetical protein
LIPTLRLVLLLLALATLAGPAAAVTLTDVRIGVHGDHTRIVLETDGKAPYIVDAGEKEIIVHVDAAATAEAVTAKSPHLIWAKVEPTQIGADVRLQLKQPSDVKAMVLTGPDRIVLDLYPRKSAALPLPAPELIAEEEPAAMAEAEPVAAPPLAEEPAAAAEAEPEQVAASEAEEAAPEMGAEPSLEEEGEAAPVSPGAEEPAEPATPEVEELAGAPEPITQPSDVIEGAQEPQGQAMAEPVRPTTPIAPAPSGGLLRSPYLLGAAAVALLFLFVFLRRRLRSAEKMAPRLREEDELPPFAPPPQRAVPVDAPSAGGESMFDVEADAIGAPPKDEDALPALRGARADAGDENERRIAHLERRIEELVDARERLERQVAAQTEELRVQRAAIARTQRVLRSVAPRGDEDGSSDAVKG